MAPPKPTGLKNASDTITVIRNNPGEESEEDGFAPRNAIPRSPPQPVAQLTRTPEPSNVTPPTKYCTPEDIGKAPRKKETKTLNTPEEVSTIRVNNADTSKAGSKPMDTPIDTDQTSAKFNMEPTLENILKVMQDVYDALCQTTLRNIPKNTARSKMEACKDAKVQQDESYYSLLILAPYILFV